MSATDDSDPGLVDALNDARSEVEKSREEIARLAPFEVEACVLAEKVKELEGVNQSIWETAARYAAEAREAKSEAEAAVETIAKQRASIEILRGRFRTLENELAYAKPLAAAAEALRSAFDSTTAPEAPVTE